MWSNMKLLSVSDVEEAIEKLSEPNEGIYPPMLYDVLEAIVKARYEEHLQSRCDGCGSMPCNGSCWVGVR